MSISTPSPTARLPRVVAVLVVTDGARWLPSVLDTVSAQHYAPLDLVVVDNASSDGSAAVLEARVPSDHRLHLPQRVGFGRAVRAGLDLPAAQGADLVLLLHDDLALRPDAVGILVRALVDDPELGVVGPKLLGWDQPGLQEVGMRIDRFGWAQNRVDPGEIDQGQHDHRGSVLYVSTAGMLVRASLFEELGGFDDRFVAFREDLELCWRAWQVGARVEVVPAAVGHHMAAASRGLRRLPRRAGGGAAWAREHAERHTLATLITCYGNRRLLTVVPAVGLLAIVKVLGFLASRRVGDALAVVRAHLWNLSQLPETLRRRSQTQRQRVLSDAELDHLFASGMPRLHAYTEAARAWLAGNADPALLEEAPPPPAPGRAGLVGFVQRHPAAVVGLVLLAIYLVGVAPLLGPGQLVGGEVAPWPDSPGAFLRAYESPWLAEPPGADGFASPVQAVLGLVSFVGLGSSWLAQRLLVLGLVPLAWVLALRAGRLLTTRVVPRVVGATVYAMSPVLLGALSQGRWSVLVVGALLPGLVHAAGRAIAPGLGPAHTWRATAGLALGLTVVLAAAPALWPVPAIVLLGAIVLSPGGRRRVGALTRLAVATTAAAALLAPWVLSATATPGELAQAAHVAQVPAELVDLPLWRALLTVPASMPHLAGAGVLLPAATVLAVALTGTVVALRLRPAVAVGLLTALVGTALLASTLARGGVETVPQGLAVAPPWPPGLLLPAALAIAGLGVVAGRTLPRRHRRRRLGRARLIAALTVGAVGVALVAVLVNLAGDLPAGLRRDPELVPAFVSGDEERVGPYQVLLLAVGDDGAVRWDLVGSGGPRMTTFGAQPPWRFLQFVQQAVEGAVGATDPGAAARLGTAGVRYVVLAPAGSPAAGGGRASVVEALAERLEQQTGLEPEPSGSARVYRVTGWLPRMALLDAADAGSLLEPFGDVDGGRGRVTAVPPATRPGGVSLPPAAGESAVLLVTAPQSGHWSAAVDGVALARTEVAGGEVPINAFALPADAEAGARLEVGGDAGAARRAVLAAQALIALAVGSLALRPPARTPLTRSGRRPGPGSEGPHGPHGPHGPDGTHGLHDLGGPDGPNHAEPQPAPEPQAVWPAPVPAAAAPASAAADPADRDAGAGRS